MWMYVKNLRNLDRALTDASAEYAQDRQKKENKGLSKESIVKLEKLTKKQIIHRISWGILVILIIAFIAMFVINANEAKTREAINNLTDPRLLSYEAQIYEVRKLGLLFQITNDATYQNAKSAIKMSEELKTKYFVNQHYAEKELSPITLEYTNIQYELTENDSVNYLLSFNTKQDGIVRSYTVQAEYYNDELVYLNVL